MKFDGKRISKDTFIQLLDEGLPSIQNYEWMKDKIIEKEYDPAKYSAPGCWKGVGNIFEHCFCVINGFKEAIVFRYFMIRISRSGKYFREICRTALTPEVLIEFKNGRYWAGNAYEFRWSNFGDKWKIFSGRSYYDINHIGCDEVLIDNCPRLKHISGLVESVSSEGVSNSTIESIIRNYFEHPKYEILWKANGVKFEMIRYIDDFSPKKLAFMGKHNLEEYHEVLWHYDYYDVDFIKKIKESYKLGLVINILEGYQIDKYRLARFIRKQKEFYCQTYLDYLDNLETLKIDIKKAAFPKDYEEEHIRLSMQIQEIRQGPTIKKYNKEYVSCANQLLPFERSDKYKIVIPKRLEDFLREGQLQRICVFSNGYYKHVIEHNAIILFVRTIDNPDKPYVCVELDNKFNILQARIFKNDPAPKEVNDYLKEVTTEYKRMYGSLTDYWNKVGECYANVQ